MQLTKLEISGFKSFAKKTELVFEPGITGILGPNGCGKSNIADAFRFVLGEQSARTLRGKKTEDFIFGGTEKRKPLSYCEVSVTFDNTDGTLASPYSEVTVTRRAYRSGESEYFINKTACRLRDIQELFRDTGIGKDGYSIIGQGRVSEILSDRSNDRRLVFEEAAGVMKYRTRKEEAERKLQNTAKNLVRLEDILHELESRVEPLREQSEKASLYFKLREELRDYELNLFIYQYERTAERSSQLRTAAEQLESELAAAVSEEAGLAAVCADEESAERALYASISEATQRLITLTAAVESELGEEKLLNEKLASAGASAAHAKEEIASARSAVSENEASIALLEDAVNGHNSDADQLRADLEAAQCRLDALEADIDEKDSAVEARKQAMMNAMNRLADTKSRVSRLEAMREALLSRLDALASERAAAEDEGKKLDDEYSELSEAVRSVDDAVAKLRSERDAYSQRISAGKKQLETLSVKLRRAEDELNAIASRRKVLEEMKRAHEGYYASVRKLLNDSERDPALKERIHGVVAELISVPKEYERAVEFALGASLQNIIVPTEQDAKAVINYLRTRDYGRATLLPVSAMRPRLLSSEERSYIDVEGCFGVASELVSYSPAFRGVIENLLGRTVIVRDIDTGIQINKKARSAFRIATLDGDILNPGGSMTGGSVQKREFSLLGREREIEELAERAVSTGERADELRDEIMAAQTELSIASSAEEALAARIQKLQLSAASTREKAEITEKYVQKNREAIEKLDGEADRIRDAVNDIDEQKADAARAEALISEGNAEDSSDIKAAQQELAGLRAALKKLNDETASIRVRLMAAEKETGAAYAEIARLQKENARLEARIAELTAGIAASEAACAELRSKLDSAVIRLNEDRAKADALSAELKAMEEERAGHLRLLDETRARREQLLERIAELKERIHKGELSLSKLKSDLENMSERIWQDYELTYENALPYRRQISAAQMHSRIEELRRSIKELGEVNTSAIEDYRSVRERYDDLSAQCADLNKAADDLNELIAKLSGTMEKEFSEQFERIRVNFSKTFRALFGGGRAELVLSDKNDVLNCNIDIIAQPPGKKLQLLTLLSGGEQALTAIALLFAILELKPAAFCILDEIDTSLDEANVDCFAEYLKSYASGTQFIIITHRKGSMAVCNTLYGVSMEEKGVSNIVSAKFD